MVGVPGRSKACGTCRTRRKKCDQKHPVCSNCTRKNILCTGYDRDMILIQVDGKGKGTYRAKQPQQPIIYQSQASLHDPSPADVRYRDLNRAAFEVECLAGFLHLAAPQVIRDQFSVNTSKEPDFVYKWWGQVFHKHCHKDVVRCSFLAISAFLVGHHQQNPALWKKAIELNSESARLMRMELEPARLAKRDSASGELEMAGYAMGLYEYYRQEMISVTEVELPETKFRKFYDRDELSFSPRVRGHIGAMLKLLSFENPEICAKPVLHQVFVQLRRIDILLAIEKRRGTFLASEKWIVGPWKDLPKTYHDTIFDALAPLAGALEAWDELKSMPADEETCLQASNLKATFRSLAQALKRWHDELSTACPTFGPEEAKAVREHIQNRGPEDLPGMFYQYAAWYLLVWNIYWYGCIIIYSTMPLVYLRFPPTAGEHIIMAPYTIGTYCASIAKSVKYFLRGQDAGLLLQTAIRTPVHCVQRALANPILRATDDPKFDEAEKILNNIGRPGWNEDTPGDVAYWQNELTPQGA